MFLVIKVTLLSKLFLFILFFASIKLQLFLRIHFGSEIKILFLLFCNILKINFSKNFTVLFSISASNISEYFSCNNFDRTLLIPQFNNAILVLSAVP